MVYRTGFGVPGLRVKLLLCLAVTSLLAMLALALAPAHAGAQAESKRLLLYTGTTGFRHSDAINQGNDAENEIEVVRRGALMDLYINGQRVDGRRRLRTSTK